jgi:hypothetical protein
MRYFIDEKKKNSKKRKEIRVILSCINFNREE